MKLLYILLIPLLLGGCEPSGIDKTIVNLREGKGYANYVEYKGEKIFFFVCRITQKEFGKILAGEQPKILENWTITEEAQ